jgi:Flp pilus assembly protein TadD
MKKMIQTILLVCLVFNLAQAQDNEVEKLVGKGVALHDKGDYNGAIKEYEKAIKIDPNSTLANTEMANTYFAMKEYDKAISHADKVIEAGSRFSALAYATKGSALDMQGKQQDAIKVYQKGLKEHPKDYFLNYNLAFTSYNVKEYDQAEKALEKSLTIDPTKPSSHLLMGFVMDAKNDRVKALLALYNFLILEPTGDRAKQALKLADQLMKKGVVKESSKKTNIFLSGSDVDTADQFSAANLMLSMLAASRDLEKNKGKSSPVLFMENAKSFLAVLTEIKKNNSGFWWNYYVGFYDAMMKDKSRAETFGYLISVSWDDKTISAWLLKNKNKIESLVKWYENYDRK